MPTETAGTAQPDLGAEQFFFEKRREPRLATCEPAEIYVLDMQGLRLPGILRDVSRNGLRIEINMPLKPSDRLEIVLENRAIFFGQVRYCRRVDDCYHAGVLIGDVLYPKGILPADAGESRMKADTARQWPATPAGAHINPREAQGFVLGKLSDTKAALIDRHLASCKTCLDLVLLTLEQELAGASCPAGANDICETQLH